MKCPLAAVLSHLFNTNSLHLHFASLLREALPAALKQLGASATAVCRVWRRWGWLKSCMAKLTRQQPIAPCCKAVETLPSGRLKGFRLEWYASSPEPLLQLAEKASEQASPCLQCVEEIGRLETCKAELMQQLMLAKREELEAVCQNAHLVPPALPKQWQAAVEAEGPTKLTQVGSDSC